VRGGPCAGRSARAALCVAGAAPPRAGAVALTSAAPPLLSPGRLDFGDLES
jgi:hypothetical protein